VKRQLPDRSRFKPKIQTYRHHVNYLTAQPFWIIFGLPFLLLALGTTGYMLIEGWPILDAIFMTVITISTIGYGEVLPLSHYGRLFTIVLIVIGVISASYALTAAVEFVSSNEFLNPIRQRRRQRVLDKIKDHCIICGFGRLGRSLAQELQARGTAVIAIDLDRDAAERCRQMGIPAVTGNASDENTLREAGLVRAKSLVTATASDAENVFIILTAKSINPNLTIISRCNKDTSVLKLEKAGADTVISPYAIAGRRVAHILTHPNVTSFLDGVLEFGDHQMRLEEFVIGPKSPLAGKTLSEAKLNAVVLAVDPPDEERVFTHPHADTRLLPGTAIIAMGLDQELYRLAKQVKGE